MSEFKTDDISRKHLKTIKDYIKEFGHQGRIIYNLDKIVRSDKKLAKNIREKNNREASKNFKNRNW